MIYDCEICFFLRISFNITRIPISIVIRLVTIPFQPLLAFGSLLRHLVETSTNDIRYCVVYIYICLEVQDFLGSVWAQLTDLRVNS